MVKLLMHFYNLNDGSIIIDGHDVNEYDVHELRKNIAMVLQDTWLYSGTIKENLRYGRLDASDEEIIIADNPKYQDYYFNNGWNGRK